MNIKDSFHVLLVRFIDLLTFSMAACWQDQDVLQFSCMLGSVGWQKKGWSLYYIVSTASPVTKHLQPSYSSIEGSACVFPFHCNTGWL